jgi:ribosomal protein S14
MKHEMIEIGGRRYRKFIPYPGPVNDGTSRCISCGQIDESPYHDMELCRRALTDGGANVG